MPQGLAYIRPIVPVLDDVREAIHKEGLSIYSLSQATGISTSVVSRFLRGGGVNVSTLEALAHQVGLRVVVRRARK